MSRRLVLVLALVACVLVPSLARAEKKDPKVKLAAQKGLDWLVGEQHRQGYWEANQGQYRVAMTATFAFTQIGDASSAKTREPPGQARWGRWLKV